MRPAREGAPRPDLHLPCKRDQMRGLDRLRKADMGAKYWIGMVLAACAGLAMAGGSAEIRKQVEASTLVTGMIDIEPDGSVSAHVIDHPEKLPEAVANLIGRASPGWRFEPILVDGKPIRARTKMSVRIVARKLEDDRVAMRIGSAVFGQEIEGEYVSSRNLQPPRYPAGAAYAGVAGTVYLVLRIGRNGTVEQVHAEQVNLRVVARNEAEMNRWRDMLAETSVLTAKRWKFGAANHRASCERPLLVRARANRLLPPWPETT
jgi:hypothetical protein